MAESTNTLLPYYFFIGEDELKRATVTARLKDRVAKLGDLDFNLSEFEGGKSGAAEIVAACETLPFLCDYRLVIVSHAEKIPAAQGKIIAAYLEQPNDFSILVLSGESLDGKTVLGKFFSKAPANATVDCSIGDVSQIVVSLAKKHGAQIDKAAALTLIDLVGKDTVRLNSEVEKLALGHVGDCAISVAEVRSSCAKTVPVEFKPWEFLDAFSNKDAALCFRILGTIDDDEIRRLHGMCLTRVKELMAARSSRLGTTAALAAELGKKDWQVKNYGRMASRFTEDQLANALIEGVEADAAMKSGTTPRDAMTTWLLQVLSPVSAAGRR